MSAIDNSENIKVIKYSREIISPVGIYPMYVKVVNLKLKLGAIFELVTRFNYRGKSFTTILLKDAIERTVKENCSVSILWIVIFGFYRKLSLRYARLRTVFHFNNSNIETKQLRITMNHNIATID
ncbi:MAG: GNAT family N-acetyltransferase [Thermoproteota archaeon]|nr:GNAT family N-acetyltransferase [Candidatus Brockarchaeota archaeon]MBO3767956.1 GNAT family N-acetyltransferase [Candidatus Brockarchaeota archaeon]MBO3801944.1 GNAT family N-acetyltransferase [Candidatus Brockarchaeota archaeon]